MEQDLQKDTLVAENNNDIVLKKNSKKKLLIVIALCAVGFLVLVYFLLSFLYPKKGAYNNMSSQKPVQELSGSVIFDPARIASTTGKQSTVDIILNTGGKKIKGVILAIKYDPRILENVALTPFLDPSSALLYSLKADGQTTKDTFSGGLIMSLKLPQGINDLAGTGKVAQLTYAVKPLNVAVSTTSIEFTQLTGLLFTGSGEKTNLVKNKLIVTLPPGVPLSNTSTIVK